jgi:hypothetical protein
MLLESLLGSWKIYAHALSPDGTYHLPFPDRILHPLLKETEWRDKAGMNSFVIKVRARSPLGRGTASLIPAQSAFPAVTAAYAQDWQERAEFGFADVYDRVVLFDRRAARAPVVTVGDETGAAPVPRSTPLLTGVAELETHPDFWLAVRDSLLQSIPPSSHLAPTRPVVTYVSRQKAKVRRLSGADHQRLVTALKALEDRYEVHIVDLPSLSRHDQVHLAARTDVRTGVVVPGPGHSIATHSFGSASTAKGLRTSSGFRHARPSSRSSRPRRGLGATRCVDGCVCPPKESCADRSAQLPAGIVAHAHYGIWNDTLVHDDDMASTPSSVEQAFEVTQVPVRPGPVRLARRSSISTPCYNASAQIVKLIATILEGRDPPTHLSALPDG